MCITSAEAKLSKTRILSLPLDNGRHLLSYSNKVKNLSGKPNSMILPVPGELNQDWFSVTTEYNKFLEEIENQAYRKEHLTRGLKSKGMLSIEEFEVGFYKVITTNSIDALREKLNTLNEAQRPEISDELLDFFKNNYKGWNFVVCIFAETKEMESQPIMFEYKPFHYEWIYYPMMDSHTGEAPNLNEDVRVDHTLILEHTGLKEGNIRSVKFSQDVPEKLRRRKFVSTKWKGRMKNGDMYININLLKEKTDDAGSSYRMFKRGNSHPEEIAVIF